MDLIDEQDDPAFGFLDFVEDCLQSFFEFTTELSSCDQRSHIQCEDGLVFQPFRHVAIQNTLRQSFYNSRFTNTRFSDQYRVVLGSSGKYLYRMSDLSVSANYRIKLSFSGHLYQIPPVLIQCVVILFRVLTCHSLISSHLIQCLQEFIFRDAVSFENFCGRCVSLVQQCQIKMFHTDILVLHFLCFFLRIQKELLQSSCGVHGFCTA